MRKVANPIYDAVFKYLLEDPAIAQLLLRTLLQREVFDVTVCPQEFTADSRRKTWEEGDVKSTDVLSLLRIDFTANVREKDGKLRHIHIELQRRWVETEIIRFRRYLGTQYTDPANILRPEDSKGSKKRYGIPIVTIYLLGNCLDEIREPVLYVRHKHFDYQDNEVAKDVLDPFIESLVHDTIIVQIPLLKQHREGRIFEVLSIFDQKRKDRDDSQMLNMEDDAYQGDSEMQLILRRLVSACSDSEVRRRMDIEDEFNMALDNRDAAIELLDERIAEQCKMISEQEGKISEQEGKISEQEGKISEQEGKISEQEGKISEQRNALMNWAKSLLAQGMQPHVVAKMTTLSIDVIESLA